MTSIRDDTTTEVTILRRSAEKKQEKKIEYNGPYRTDIYVQNMKNNKLPLQSHIGTLRSPSNRERARATTRLDNLKISRWQPVTWSQLTVTN